MVERVLFAPGGATEPKQDDIIAALASLLIELNQKLEAGQAVALDAATLAALEAITVSGTVALDAPTLAALESITATISGAVALDAPTLAALENITATISGTVPVSGPLTDTELRAADVNMADSGERTYTHVVATATASGDTTIHTPAAGMRVRLRWIYAINDPASTSPPLIKVKLGSTEIYRVWALSKRQLVLGAVDAPLVINLASSGTVAVTAILEEI